MIGSANFLSLTEYRSALWLHAGDDAPVAEGWFHLNIRETRLLEHLNNLTARILLSGHRRQHSDVKRGNREWAGAVIIEQ